jgi:hypothetical protein
MKKEVSIIDKIRSFFKYFKNKVDKEERVRLEVKVRGSGIKK